MTSGHVRGVAFDLDGTLLRSDGSISEAMRALCEALTAQGVLLTLISSRPPRSVEQLAHGLGLESPWAALNGAIVCGQGTFLDRSPLPEEAVDHILSRYARDERVSVNLYAGFDWIVQAMDRRVGIEAEIIGFSPTVEAGFARRPVTDKILLITDAGSGDGARVVEELAALGDSGVAVARSKENYIEITRSGVDKGRALELIAASRGLSARDWVAAGDGENDIPMLERCGLSIAMQHSPPALKAVAAMIVGSNDDDSLPRAVGRIFGVDAGIVPAPDAAGVRSAR